MHTGCYLYKKFVLDELTIYAQFILTPTGNFVVKSSRLSRVRVNDEGVLYYVLQLNYGYLAVS